VIVRCVCCGCWCQTTGSGGWYTWNSSWLWESALLQLRWLHACALGVISARNAGMIGSQGHRSAEGDWSQGNIYGHKHGMHNAWNEGPEESQGFPFGEGTQLISNNVFPNRTFLPIITLFDPPHHLLSSHTKLYDKVRSPGGKRRFNYILNTGRMVSVAEGKMAQPSNWFGCQCAPCHLC